MIQVLRETHEAPASVQQRIRCAGGTNRFGEPNFRVVWGGSRLTWIGGRWTDRDAHGNLIREAVELRQVPKYVPADRWHIERWTPPEFYGSPELWYEQTAESEEGRRVPALGPYPARGEYEHCFTLETPAGEFIPLNPAACDWIVRAVEWSRRQPRQAKRLRLPRAKPPAPAISTAPPTTCSTPISRCSRAVNPRWTRLLLAQTCDRRCQYFRRSLSPQQRGDPCRTSPAHRN